MIYWKKFTLNLDDFERIEADLRSKFTCTYDNNYLFYCYVSSESLEQFPPIKFNLENQLSLTIEPKDYVIFVK